ncbi:Kinase D-interacting substrate of 220 kDa [Schistosoma japonicum]|nr:Kinase D-interacting substrate of 220 kDa [Schistosoma japonicum]
MSTPVSPSLGCARLELKNTQCSSITITDGMKLLRHAVSSGNSDKVHKLLKCSHISPIDHGADMPIICTAAWKGYTDIIGLLIRHGASVNTRSTEGSTALIYAADGVWKLISLLSYYLMDIIRGHLTVLSLLLDAGALINITNCHGESALTRATRRGWVHCARFLLSHGANPNPMPSDGHSFVVSPLHLARQMHQTIIEQDILKRTVEIDKAVAEIVSTTLPNHLTLIEPGHLPDTKSMSLFPVQIISSVELSRFVLYFKTPPGYGSRSPLVGSKESSGSTPSDELIFIYVIRAQLCSSSYDSVVLIGGYRIRLDVTSLIMASMNPVSPKGTTKASVYIPRSGI